MYLKEKKVLLQKQRQKKNFVQGTTIEKTKQKMGINA